MIVEFLLWSNSNDATIITNFLTAADVAWASTASGILAPVKQCQIDIIGQFVKSTGPTVMYPGFYANVRFYGADALAMTNGYTQTDAGGNLLSVWVRTNMTTQIPTLVLNSPVPQSIDIPLATRHPGTGCYLYDTAATSVKGRMRVWA